MKQKKHLIFVFSSKLPIHCVTHNVAEGRASTHKNQEYMSLRDKRSMQDKIST
jgi:hypothetical protein